MGIYVYVYQSLISGIDILYIKSLAYSMKGKKSLKKYTYDNNINDGLPNHAHIADIREQLRQSLEQLEQSKLTIQLQNQKRILAEHQYQQIKEQNVQIKSQMEGIRRQLNKLSKKYMKMRENQKQTCEKCKQNNESKDNAERERQVFMKERGVLKNEIKELKRVVQNFENRDSSFGGNTRIVEQLRRQLSDGNKMIEEQKKIIRYLDQKLSLFELQKLQTLNYVESIDQKLQELQMQNNILKGFSTTGGWKQGKGEKGRQKQRPISFLQSPSRRNGSIKNFQKINKSRSRSRDSPKY